MAFISMKRDARRGASIFCILLAGFFATSLAVNAATNFYYVSKSGTHTPPYATWDAAATNIQNAIDEAEGDVGGGDAYNEI